MINPFHAKVGSNIRLLGFSSRRHRSRVDQEIREEDLENQARKSKKYWIRISIVTLSKLIKSPTIPFSRIHKSEDQADLQKGARLSKSNFSEASWPNRKTLENLRGLLLTTKISADVQMSWTTMTYHISQQIRACSILTRSYRQRCNSKSSRLRTTRPFQTSRNRFFSAQNYHLKMHCNTSTTNRFWV